MKYEIGDLVSKPVTGICKIEDILYLNLLDEKNKKMYYLIKPIEDEKDKIYVPVSNSDSRLRLCLTKEEAWNLIKRIPEIPTAWINNEKMREQSYKDAIKANDPEALVAIIKMIYERKQKRLLLLLCSLRCQDEEQCYTDKYLRSFLRRKIRMDSGRSAVHPV